MIDWEFEIIEDKTKYIEEVLPRTKHFDMVSWRMIDPKHPKCYYCGKFVPVKWNRSEYTGPCTDCDEYIGLYSIY